MPFIREYAEGKVGEEDNIVVFPRQSPLETALHETIHAVILRLDGLDIAKVVENDDAGWTLLIEPQKYTVAALMAPEVYMSINNIDFDDISVSSDRSAVAECIRPEVLEDALSNNRVSLEIIFQCPHVRAAIDVLTAHMDVELRKHKIMSGASIHEIIDPILKHSPHADGLRGWFEMN